MSLPSTTSSEPLRVFIAACLFAIGGTASAQEAPTGTSLGTAVENGNGTALQISTGNSVNAVCGQLLNNGFRDVVAENRAATSPEEDLFFRCNEMVMTANGLNSNGQLPPGQGPALNSLGFTNSELAEAMQQLTGEEQASKGRLATETSVGHFDNIAMRIDAIRLGARASAGGLNLSLGGVPLIGGNAGEGGDAGGWGWFVNGAVGFGDRDDSDREDAYDYDSRGATLGIDYQFAGGGVIGFAFGYNDFEVDFDNRASNSGSALSNPVSGGEIEIDGYVGSGYAVWNLGRFSVDAIFSYGENDYENERIVRYTGSESGGNRGQGLVVDRLIKGDTEDETIAFGSSIGTTFELGTRTDLFVFGGVSYLNVEIDGYTEVDTAVNGGLNLTYEDQDIDSLQSRLGGQLTRPFSTGFGVVVPYLDAEWRHEFENDEDTVVARYASQEVGTSFNLNVETDGADTDYFEIGAGLSAVFARNIQAFVDYRTVLGLSDTTAHLVSIGIRGTF